MKLLGFKKILSSILNEKKNKIEISLWDNEDLSLPIPSRLKNGKLVETMFVYTRPNSEDGSDVGLPNALLKINSTNGEIIGYNLCDESEFSYVNRYTPIRNNSFDFKNRDYNIRRLYEVYEKVRSIVFSDKVSSQDVITLAEFRTLFYKVIYKEHIPYYHELGKEFFAWIDKSLS